MSRFDWDKAKRRDTEAATPRGEKSPAGAWTHVKRAPVKTWKDMTPAERAAVVDALKSGKHKP